MNSFFEGTRFTIGEPDGAVTGRCQEISAAFKAGGLRAPVEANLRNQIWLKLVGNVAFNPVTALTRATLGELGDLPAMRELLIAMFAECAAVAGQLGIEFPACIMVIHRKHEIASGTVLIRAVFPHADTSVGL